jgi:hypothetical protein
LGNDHGDLQSQITLFQQEITDSITTQHNTLSTRLDELELSLNTTLDASQAQVDTARQEILDFIRSTHLVDPFDMAVNICATYGPDAEVGEAAGLDLDFLIGGSVGIDFYGNGVTVDYGPDFHHGTATDIGSEVSLELQACINGLFYRQNGDVDDYDPADLLPDELELLNLLFAAGSPDGDTPGDRSERQGLRGNITDSATDFSTDLSVGGLAGAITALRNGSFRDTILNSNTIADPFSFANNGPDNLKNGLPLPEDVRDNLGNSFPSDTFSNFADPSSICALFTGNTTVFDASIRTQIGTLCSDGSATAAILEDAFDTIADLPNQITSLFNGANTFTISQTNNLIDEINTNICTPLNSTVNGIRTVSINLGSFGPYSIPKIKTPSIDLGIVTVPSRTLLSARDIVPSVNLGSVTPFSFLGQNPCTQIPQVQQ